ncbi:PP2C family protein-serine/threonine phosphatase [candidate division KSB1 bacterium]
MSDNAKQGVFYYVLPLILCVAGILSGLMFFSNNDIYNCLKSGKTEAEIRETADELMNFLGYDADKYKQSVSKHTMTGLIEYVQREEISHTDAIDLPLYRWRVIYTIGEPGRIIETETSGIVINNDEINERGYERITLRFSPEGMLNEINLSREAEGIITEQIRQTLLREESESYAMVFINRFTNVDTSKLEVVSRNILQQQGGREDIEYEFEHKDSRFPGLTDNISLLLSDGRITKFNRNISPDDSGTARSEEILEIIFAILTGVAWVIVVVIAIYIFITKARKDQLDFVKIWWVGGFTLLSMIGIIAADEADILGILLGGGLGGSIIGLIMAFAYGTGESITRESDREKLRSIDAIFQGNFFVREIGEAILKGIALAGGALIIIFALKWLFMYIPGTMIKGVELINQSNPFSSFIEFISGNILIAIGISISLFLIWGSYINGRIKSRWIKVLLLGLFVSITEWFEPGLGPRYYSFLMFIPLGILVSYVYFKEEYLTIFIWIVLFLFLSRVQEFSIISPSRDILFSSIAYGFLGLLYVTGVVTRKYGVSTSKLREYVPEYALRLAERERIHQELEIAKKVQMDLLPNSTPDYPYAEIETMCIPALEVGGDYFDFFPYDDKRLGLIIGDVSGKGVPAAFYMTLVKGILKTLVKSKQNPKDILCRLNQIFCENVPKNVFISAIYGVIDFEQRILTFSRAGHMPLILCRKKGGEFRQFTPKGMAIGLDNTIKFDSLLEEKSIQIEGGDMFLFFTDGISEANNISGEEFGEERLAEIIEKYSDSSPKKIIKKIYKEVTDFQGDASRHDDITAVAVKIAQER